MLKLQGKNTLVEMSSENKPSRYVSMNLWCEIVPVSEEAINDHTNKFGYNFYYLDTLNTYIFIKFFLITFYY